MTNTTISLVTGANRGMGLEIVKELATAGQTVLLGSRDLNKGQEAAQKLAAEGLAVEAIQLDITDTDAITRAVDFVSNKYGRLDVLINNAGASFDKFQDPSILKLDVIRREFELNVFGTIDMTQQFIPLLKKSPNAKIINISSMMGSLTEALNPQSSVYNASSMGYQATKSALNMFTVQLAKEFQRKDIPITVNAIDPGLVATEFGGTSADSALEYGAQPVEVGVARTVELVTSPDNDITATFSNTHGEVNW
ncbi:SDR family oxidoreductase [Lacticaseibacillus saniviri]|uniref:Carbonyl reductase n=1 Tax=Lacticaseibacillus saniviri JCM 17471 = DSM 24301 TaxID=1293598 RepID=A0A0R2MUC2_9LACO|nr:SDR family oxidoreductase [Lacticaseibacillus saniviri]KRO15155.1 carbonyl reductase [Lacticaseibacillus saniviri JCM 17471 = DSM 24301]MCG4281140.1 SDR family oxidoreductase [Lacticaseibacillus saniviri]